MRSRCAGEGFHRGPEAVVSRWNPCSLFSLPFRIECSRLWLDECPLVLPYDIPRLGGPFEQIANNVVIELRAADLDFTNLQPEVVHAESLVERGQTAHGEVQNHKTPALIHLYNLARKTRVRRDDHGLGSGELWSGTRRRRERVKSLRAEPIGFVGASRCDERAEQNHEEPDSHLTSKIGELKEVNSQVAR